MRDALVFWLLVEAVGLAALPLAALLFTRLPGCGLALARPLGLLVLAYPAWLLASVRLVPNGRTSVPLGLGVLAVLAAVLARPALTALRRPATFRLWLAGEVVFTTAFFGCALVRGFAPDVWNTEKPMDMAFVNAVSRSEWFPPHDPWLSGESLNYYYFGHYLVSLLVRATGVSPDVGFNLAVALFFALVASSVFAVASTLSLAWTRGLVPTRPVVHGLVAVGVTLLLGNLAGAAELLGDVRPLREYDWWSPSRVIDGTANEFPLFSFLLGDLHAHVMVTPFALVALCYALQLALTGPPPPQAGRKRAAGELLLAALVLGSLAAVNSLDFPTAALLLTAGLALWLVSPAPDRPIARSVAWLALLFGVALALFAPFLGSYRPDADGIALVREHESFTGLSADLVLIYSFPFWVVAAALAYRLRAPVRYLLWSGTALLVLLVLLAPSRLAGLFVVLSTTAVALYAALDTRLAQPERFFWLLVGVGLALVAVGDFAYLRDAFDGTASYRFNTVFKAGYQAWFLLSIAAAVGVYHTAGWLRTRGLWVWRAGLTILLVGLLVYPVAGTYARTNGFSDEPTLAGLRWLEESSPEDAAAVDWLRRTVDGTPVVLEAVGPDFSQQGHARVSTFTGLPTVIGWRGHELQWGHDPGTRAADVEAIYATRDPELARRLLDRYGVRYVFVGSLERTRYPAAALAKFERLGEVAFRKGRTAVYAIST